MVFAVLASLILVSQIAMQAIPGVQLVGVFIAAITLTYRVRALIPIYVYVLLYCLLHFNLFSLPYLYIWLPLWGMFMLAGKIKPPPVIRIFVYSVLCGLFGLSFGVLYAPFQALIFGLNFQGMITWIKFGLPFDFIAAVNNFALGVLILPLSELLRKLHHRTD
jgi:hypothetical protein